MAAMAQETKPKIELTTPVERVVYEPLSRLYVGEAILIHPSSDGSVDLKNVRIISEQAEVSREGDDFVIIAKQAGEITLRIYDFSVIEKPVLIETQKVMAAVSYFYAGVSASLNGKTGGRITHAEIIDETELKILSPPDDGSKDASEEIVSYMMSVFHKERDPVLNIQSEGSKLTPEMKAVIKESPKGAKIYFEYVKARSGSSDDNSTRSLPPLSFVLADD